MQLIKRIDSHPAIQAYVQEVSADVVDVLQRIAMYKALALPSRGCNCSSSVVHDFQDYMASLTQLGTTQRLVDSGCVLPDSVGPVLLSGNIRERCSVLFNLFVNSNQRSNIFAQLLQFSNATKHSGGKWGAVEQTEHSPDSSGDALQGHKAVSPCGRRPESFFAAPSCIHSERLQEIQDSAAALRGHSGEHCSDETQMACNVQATRKYLGSCSYKTRCVCRVLRNVETRRHFALRRDRIWPPLSQRELYFQKSATTPRYKHSTLSPFCIWQTGHMTWEMDAHSAFAQEARQRNESVIAGPSGHTHRLMNAMKIFRNFDADKWVLICIVWLVGSDHHSTYEVLVGAQHHGVQMCAGVGSLQMLQYLLDNIK